MPTLDLPEAHLRAVCELLAQQVPGAEVWAYGSRVGGSHHAGSDLDLVVREQGPTIEARAAVAKLRATLAESALPFLVDVVDWTRLPAAFRREIEKRHVVLQTPGNAAQP